MKRIVSLFGILTLFISGIFAAPARAQQPAPPSAPKLYFEPCAPFDEQYTFDCYHSYDETAAFLREAADRYPAFVRVESVGKSFQGRDLWMITVTDFSTGDPDAKPAIWIDGGIDADEVVASEAALGVVHRLLTSDEPEVAELRRTRTFYIAPTVIPDASELHHTTPIRPRDTTLRPWDDDNDGELDEDGPEDLDGDNQALQMRVRDPTGDWVQDERDGRLLRERRPGDTGPFYRLYPEGLDNDDDGEFGEDPLGGIDPNRNYPGNWTIEQGGSGPMPGSERELRALLDFALDHPNIAASQHFHSSGGVILRPPSVPNLELPPSDQQLYMALARQGLEVTGYDLATTVYDWNWPRGSRNTKPSQVWRDAEGEVQVGTLGSFGGFGESDHPAAGESAYPAYGGSIDAMYLLFGALSFANEIYQMGEDEDGDGRIEPIEQLRHNDEKLDRAAFREWTKFDHPQLGVVEIGGWKKFGHNNPLPEQLPEEVRRNVDFALVQAAATPLLTLPEAEVEDLGGGVYRVRAVVRNAGFQPTELAIRERYGRAVPVRIELSPATGVELLSADSLLDLGILGGYVEEEAEWLVRGSEGAEVRVTAWHPKAGRIAVSKQLSAGGDEAAARR